MEDSELKFNSPALMEEIKFQHSQVLFESLEPSDTIRSRHRNPEQVSHSDVLSNIPLISNNLDKGMGFGELETKQTTKEESESFLHSLLVLLAISAVTMLNFGLGAIIGNVSCQDSKEFPITNHELTVFLIVECVGTLCWF